MIGEKFILVIRLIQLQFFQSGAGITVAAQRRIYTSLPLNKLKI
jgi:hypothetical protein